MSKRSRKSRKRAPSYKRGDHYSRQARSQGYAARSVFKLEEIQRRARVLRPGDRVVDLGCFPGSWSRYAREVVGASGRLVGVDFDAPQGIDGVFLEGSVLELEPGAIREALGGDADVVVSDMAPRTTGDRFSDHVRQIELADRALYYAAALLRPGGHFVAKVFEGADAPAYVDRVRARFAKVRRLKPKATRDSSVEFFVIGLDRLFPLEE